MLFFVEEEVETLVPPLDDDNNEISHSDKDSEKPIPLRRSNRITKTLVRFDQSCFLVESDYEKEPKTYQEAMSSAHSKNFISAMDEEMAAIKDNNTWYLTSLPKDRKELGSKWIYKTEKDSTGKIKLFKARIIAKGFSQIEGLYFFETFAPLAKTISIRLILGLANLNN